MSASLIELHPIGVIKTPFTDPSCTPLQSVYSEAEGLIEIHPDYAPGLENLHEFSHLFLIYQFHKAPTELLIERPLTGSGLSHGIFSTRHMSRPNRIGLSVILISGIEGNTIRFTGADMLDGSILLDIKPYIPAFDCIPDASSGWVVPTHLQQIKTKSASCLPTK